MGHGHFSLIVGDTFEVRLEWRRLGEVMRSYERLGLVG